MGRPSAPLGARKLDPAGYVRVRVHEGHPLVVAGWAREHRLVLWDTIGPGRHPCHYCAAELEWGLTLEVDHLDHDRTANTIDNLVPACRSCQNAHRRAWGRGLYARTDTGA